MGLTKPNWWWSLNLHRCFRLQHHIRLELLNDDYEILHFDLNQMWWSSWYVWSKLCPSFMEKLFLLSCNNLWTLNLNSLKICIIADLSVCYKKNWCLLLMIQLSSFQYNFHWTLCYITYWRTKQCPSWTMWARHMESNLIKQNNFFKQN